MMHVSEKGEKC